MLTSLGEDETEERADVYYKLGCIKREQGQAKQAINNFEKALGVDAAHRPTLEALVGIYAELKDWKQVVAYKRQILDNVFDGDERFKILDRDRRHLERPGQEPAQGDRGPRGGAGSPAGEPRRSSTSCSQLYQATQNWTQMIDTIQAHRRHGEGAAIARRSSSSRWRSSTATSMDDQDRAVELFNEALDLNPSFLEAFERINKILTAQKDWKQLERAFRKMLHRCRAASGEHATSSSTSGTTSASSTATACSDVNSAIEAFKMATRFKPDEPVERQILAELYEPTEQLEAAIGEHAQVLQKDPLRVDPYRALYKLYLEEARLRPRMVHVRGARVPAQGRRGRAALLRGLPPAGHDPGEEPARQRAVGEEPLPQGREPLHRQDLRDDHARGARREDRRQLAKAKQLPVLDRRFKQDPATSTVTFAKTFGWAAQVLGIQLPELYVRNDVPGALVAVPSTSAGVASRARRCSPASRRRSSRSSSASTSATTAASTTSRTSSRRSAS